MAIIVEIPHTQQELNKFAADHWDKALAFLQGRFSLPRSECEDIFQEAYMVFHRNITEGKLTKLTASITTYFLGICNNKALEWMRSQGKGKELNIIDEFPDTTKDEFEDDRIEKLLALEDNDELIEERKEAIARQIVSTLPDPCDKILWGFYRDGLSMKMLAQMYNYSSESSVKVTKHRCGEKFKTSFLKLTKHLFD